MGMFNQKIDAIQLDATGPSPEEKEMIYEGDTVYFIGGGPPMIVTKIEHSEKNENVWVTVGWFDELSVYHRELFQPWLLTHGEDLEDTE